MKEQILYKENNFNWDGIDCIEYKSAAGEGGNTFKNVLRQNLIAHDDDIGFDIRYFECAPDGFTTLEKHEHIHAVIIVRGKGRVVVGSKVITPKPFDLIKIPSWTPHQLINISNEPFGFFCTVNGLRDKFKLLDREEIETLQNSTAVREAIRLPDDYFN